MACTQIFGCAPNFFYLGARVAYTQLFPLILSPAQVVYLKINQDMIYSTVKNAVSKMVIPDTHIDELIWVDTVAHRNSL